MIEMGIYTIIGMLVTGLIISLVVLFLIYSNMYYISRLFGEWWWSYVWTKHCLGNNNLRSELLKFAKNKKRVLVKIRKYL